MGGQQWFTLGQKKLVCSIMRHAANRELFSYWNELRGDRATPERNDVDPSAIRGVLADTFILEVDPDRRFPVRLSGTRFNAFFEGEQKGRCFASLWPRQPWTEVRRILAIVLDGGEAVVVGINANTLVSDPLDLELLLLPLRHHGKTHARILGCLSPGRIPIWLGLLPITDMQVTSFRIIDGIRTAPASAGARSIANRYGHLVVYNGGGD
jgi:hypothetical protein